MIYYSPAQQAEGGDGGHEVSGCPIWPGKVIHEPYIDYSDASPIALLYQNDTWYIVDMNTERILCQDTNTRQPGNWLLNYMRLTEKVLAGIQEGD